MRRSIDETAERVERQAPGGQSDLELGRTDSRTRLRNSPDRIKPEFHGRSFLVASRATFPVELATRLPDRSAGGLLRCIVCPFFRVSRRSPNSTSTTRATCCGHPREDVTRMLLGRYEETASVEFKLYDRGTGQIEKSPYCSNRLTDLTKFGKMMRLRHPHFIDR